jgi:hypothetical protein
VLRPRSIAFPLGGIVSGLLVCEALSTAPLPIPYPKRIYSSYRIRDALSR